MDKYFDKIIATSSTTDKVKTLSGYVVWRGKSPVDGAPIVGLLISNSSNAKTGNMSQLYIINESIKPSEAVTTGADVSICGMCPMRHYSGGACYVMPYQLAATYNKLQRGGYPDINWADAVTLFKGRKLRLGAYGDPAMLPFELVQSLVSIFDGHTGYTHQWYAPWYDERFNNLLQLSTDKNSSRKAAKMYPNAKQFIVVPEGYKTVQPECPSDRFGINCIDCMTCDGSKTHVQITAHGSRKGRL